MVRDPSKPRRTGLSPWICCQPYLHSGIRLCLRTLEDRKLGPYRLRAEIGRGGMGIVYRAEANDGRLVALKVLHAEKSQDETAVRRFLREGRAAKRLSHPGIVGINDLGQEGSTFWIAMDLVVGPTLAEIILGLRRGIDDSLKPLLGEAAPDAQSLSAKDSRYEGRIAELLAAVARALDYAHHEGLVHRDVKPGNLILGEDGGLRLTDFGLVRDLAADTFTKTGDVLGTPLYMSPEQISGTKTDITLASDIYSLGVTLHESLGLEPPYMARDLTGLAEEIENQALRNLYTINPALSKDLLTIVARATAKRPVDRYASAMAMAKDLERFAAGQKILAKPPGLVERSRSYWRGRHKLGAVILTLILASGFFLGFSFFRAAQRRQIREQDAALVAEDIQSLMAARSWVAAWRASREIDFLTSENSRGLDIRAAIELELMASFERALKGGIAGFKQGRAQIALISELPDCRLDQGVDENSLACCRVKSFA